MTARRVLQFDEITGEPLQEMTIHHGYETVNGQKRRIICIHVVGLDLVNYGAGGSEMRLSPRTGLFAAYLLARASVAALFHFWHK